jgi:hypothetical protein
VAIETDDWERIEPQVDDSATGGSVSNEQTSQDDWEPVSSAKPAQAKAPDDDWAAVPPDGDWSTAGSFAAGAAKGAIPTTTGLAAGLAAGAAATPLLTPVGGILVGLGVGAGTSWLAGMGQDKVLAALRLDKPLAEAEHAHPYMFFGGEAASSAALLKVPGSLMQRGVGAAIGGAAEGINEAIQGEFDPGKLGIAAGTGFALPTPNKLGSKLIAAGEQVPGRFGYRGGNKGGENPNPDLKEVPLAEGEAPDIVYEPAPQEADLTVANKQPDVAGGVSTPQPPAPEVTGAGNPEGAPMLAREGAKPGDPERNYGKESRPSVSNEGVVQKGSPVSQEVAQALTEREPASTEREPALQQPSPAAEVPAAREAAPTNDNVGEMYGITPGSAEWHEAVHGGEPRNVAEEATQRWGLPHPDAPPPTPESKVIELPQSTKPYRTDPEALPPGHVELVPEPSIGAVRERPAREPLELVPEHTITERPAPEPPVKTGLTPAEIKANRPLTPEERKDFKAHRQAFIDSGHSDMLTKLDAMPGSERQKYYRLRNGYNELEAQAKAAREGKPVEEAVPEAPPIYRNRIETPRKKLSTGATAASAEDAARKQQALDNYKKIFDELGPKSERGKSIDPTDKARMADTRAYVRETWEQAKEIMGGDPFAKLSKVYVPDKRGDGGEVDQHVQWLRGLRHAAIGRSGYKDFAAIHKAPEIATEDRATGRVAADIARGQRVPEAAGEAMTAVEASTPRETFEPMAPWKDRTGKPAADQTFVTQSNELRQWANDLSPRDYDVLAGQYKETLRPSILDADNPNEVLAEMMDVLKKSGRRETVPGKTPTGEITSEVELPAKKVDLPELPRTGGKVDLTSEYGRRLAAQYNAEAAKEKPLTKAEQLALSEAKERGLTEAAKRTEDRAPVDATNPKVVWEKAAGFLKDEQGGVKFPAIAGQLWARFRNPANPSTPGASQAAKDYAADLSDKFRRLLGDTLHRKLNIQANMHAAIADAERLKIDTPYMQRKIALAEQHGKIGALPKEVRDWYERYVVPIREQAKDVMREMKDLNDTERLGWDIPHLNLVSSIAYQPRYQVGRQGFDAKMDTAAFDPWGGRTLSGWSPNLMDRKWFSLEQQGGLGRIVFEQIDPDTIRLWRGNQPTVKIKTPASFDGKLGDVLELNVKGKPTKFTVDQASTLEINNATKGQVKFHENALWAWSRMADDMAHALEQQKLFLGIKGSKEFQALATTDRDVARDRGYSTAKTHLPDFVTEGPNKKDVYLPDAVRWALDDYHRPGFGVTSEGLERLRNFNIAMLKVFNTNAPLVHVLNELNLFTVGRGGKWLNPVANWNMVKDIGTAVKSVNAQDALQREMRNAGVNPLLATTKVHNMFKRAADQMGLEIKRDWRLWDAPFKPWGIKATEAGDHLYRLSSDVTWRLSDYLTTLRYMEERRGGWAPEDAAKRVNKFMSDYQLDTTVMGSRVLQQILADPATTSFGRYKAGVWRSLAHMTKDLVKGDPMLREQAGKAGFGSAMSELKARQEAMGQLMAVGVLATLVGPALDAALGKATGDENAEFRSRGVNAPVHAALKFKEKGVQGLISHAWTPSPAINAVSELKDNKTFSGKEIVPTGNLPGIIPEAAVNVGEYVAQTAIPPYATVSKTYSRPEGSVGKAVGNLALEQIGADIKSDAAVKRENQIERVINRGAKDRFKHPRGILPDLFNRFTE